MGVVGFNEIHQEAVERCGDTAALEARLIEPNSSKELAAIEDDRYLSLMSRRVFRAGLKHAMVDDKWPAFEELFQRFEPQIIRLMSDDELQDLMSERRIIRHWGKIKSVRANAQAMVEVADQFGSMGHYLSGWPGERVVELWHDLAKRFSQLGGRSASYFLRMAGKDTFILTNDVVRALNRWGAFQGEPKGKRNQKTVQEIFNRWADESQLALCNISLILANSVD